MRVSSKIAMELYFRIKSEEQTFDMASYVYGEGQERKMEEISDVALEISHMD